MSIDLLSTFRGIAENLLGEIDWQDAGKGFCPCPGRDLHTASTSRRDCTVFVGEDRAPSVFCVHTSCGAIIAERNRTLRSECGKAKWASEHGGEQPVVKKRPRLTAAERAKLERRRYLENRLRKAQAALPNLLRSWQWPASVILQDCPVDLGPADHHWRLLLSLYAPDDVVWIGARKETGRLHHRRFFQSAAMRLQEKLGPLGPLIAASTFRPGTFSRSKDNVAQSRFLVVESDSLSRDDVGAVFRFLRDGEHLPLRAVIDTGGRSFHAWFERPADPLRIEELLFVLPALGCDPGPLREPCMSRLPGAWRGTQQQRLVYFDRGTL